VGHQVALGVGECGVVADPLEVLGSAGSASPRTIRVCGIVLDEAKHSTPDQVHRCRRQIYDAQLSQRQRYPTSTGVQSSVPAGSAEHHGRDAPAEDEVEGGPDRDANRRHQKRERVVCPDLGQDIHRRCILRGGLGSAFAEVAIALAPGVAYALFCLVR